MAEVRICLTPRVSGVGGMVSFRNRLSARLAAMNIKVTDNLSDPDLDAVLVIGGTRHLMELWRAHRRGVRIVQRLNGMNWLHRVKKADQKPKTNLRHFLRAEYGNRNLATIRSRLAQHIVYQSEFSRRWWERVYGPTSIPSTVIYNGIDLYEYAPQGPHQRSEHSFRILLVEGSLMGGYEMGLAAAVKLADGVAERMSQPVELQVVGRVADNIRQSWEQFTGNHWLLTWAGLQPTERIPEVDRSAHLLYSSDINAACPNSVIEALACGLPVLALDTGALPEMVTGDAGRVVPYGGDSWRLDSPNIQGLIEAACEIAADQQRFRTGARLRAESAFNLDHMVERYLQALLGS